MRISRCAIAVTMLSAIFVAGCGGDGGAGSGPAKPPDAAAVNTMKEQMFNNLKVSNAQKEQMAKDLKDEKTSEPPAK